MFLRSSLRLKKFAIYNGMLIGRFHTTLFGLILVLIASQYVYGQSVMNSNEETVESELIESFDWFGSEVGLARIDHLMQRVNKSPNSFGYVIVYCGKTCRYSEVEAHFIGIREGIQHRGYDTNKVVFISGGFREKTTIEFWLVPKKACPPIPKPTFNIQEVKFLRTRTKLSFRYWCC